MSAMNTLSTLLLMVQSLWLNDVALLVIFQAFKQSVLQDIAQRKNALEFVLRIDHNEAMNS